jgi:hypothetical protein
MPAALLAEQVPVRPSRVPPEVYEQGPTAQAMKLRLPEGFVVVRAAEKDDERHAAGEGSAVSLCGLVAVQAFPLASLLIVECKGCVERLPPLRRNA